MATKSQTIFPNHYDTMKVKQEGGNFSRTRRQKGGRKLSRECLYLSCLPKPSFADMACRVGVGDMSATCLWSWCRLECLNDTTFDDMSPTLCTTEVHDCFVRGDFDRETMASSPAGSYHGLWWTDALDPVHLHDPDITGDAAMWSVGGIRPPQPEKCHYFGGDFLYAIYY